MTNRPMPLLTIPVGSSATRTKLRLILLPPSTSRLAPNASAVSEATRRVQIPTTEVNADRRVAFDTAV